LFTKKPVADAASYLAGLSPVSLACWRALTAIAGTITSALVLLRLSVPAHPQVAGTWLTDSGRRTAAAIGLNLVPFAGIAFLWFIGVIRTGSAGTRTGSSRPCS
jgi:hypothetical protein